MPPDRSEWECQCGQENRCNKRKPIDVPYAFPDFLDPYVVKSPPYQEGG